MSNYPAPFAQDRFPDIPPVVPGSAGGKGVSPKLIAKAPVQVRGTLKVASVKEAVVTALWIQETGKDSSRSQSFQNKTPASNAPIDPVAHFHFLPGIDPVEIRWTVSSPDEAKKARFELWTAADDTRAIWEKEFNDAQAVATLQGLDGAGKGPLAWSEVVLGGDAVRFPDHCPNVAFAPYQLRLTVTSKNGAVTTAWTYFDILVDSLELHWGDQGLIPAGAINNVLPIYQPLTDRDEKALVTALSQNGTRIDENAALEIPLRSTNAAYIHLQEWYAWRDFAYLRYKGRWGDGPRLPIMAKVFLKSLTGPPVHSPAAGHALGPARFLWDWQDKPEIARRNELTAGSPPDVPAADPNVVTFVMQGLKYKENAAGEPPNCLNCHTDRGGKRGGAARILPEFNSAAFPFRVTRAATRTWASFSEALTNGPHACTTGVLFQPSRMAKDTYQLRVFLATGGHEATLDVGGTMDALVAAHPGLPTAHTGMMETLRRIDARYVRKGTSTTRMDLDEISRAYAIGGCKILWTEILWTKAEFDNCMQQALTPDRSNESVAHVRSQIYLTNAKARRMGLPSMPAPVQTQLAQFDQWFGCKMGQTKAQAGAANFTLPGREVVEALFIDPAVKTYIEKSRVSNDKLRKWNTFKRANPLVADGPLRVRFFYERLTDSERNKILPAIRANYEGAGWLGWDIAANKPEEWASANYEYRMRKLVYLSEEMHVRKVLADAFEGVTFFHYEHFFDTLNADGSIYARQCDIGGVAAISMNADLGLSGAFLVWDHPTNLQRQTMARTLCARRGVTPQGGSGHDGDRHGSCTFKDGNSTAVHEFGHFLHLPHAVPTGGSLEAFMHDQNDLKCIMNYDPDALHHCGGCILRLRGWAFFKHGGVLGFSNTTPNLPGADPPAPQVAGLDALFTNFYANFV